MLTIISNAGNKTREHHISENLLSKKFVWVDAVHPDSLELRKIADAVKIPLSDLREALDEDERPRVSDIDGYSLIIFKAPWQRKKHIAEISFAIFFNKNVILTLRTKDIEAFDTIAEYRDKTKNVFQDTTYFIFRLLDAVLDSYFKLSDVIEDQIDAIEQEIFSGPKKTIVQRMFDVRKTLIYSHKALTANREVVTSIEKEYLPHIQKKHLKSFRALYNDITQLVDLMSTYRDVLTGTLDTYLSSVSYNLNITIKRLTAYGSLILVPTLISGIYGMNFKVMPEIYWKHGYGFALGLMVVSVFALYIYFKKKDWI